MTQIGEFTKTRAGYAGQIKTLTIDTKVVLVRVEKSDKENTPDFRILAGDGTGNIEIGAAWKRTGEKAGTYVSLQIDDPSLAHPIRASLFQSTTSTTKLVLLWNRPRRKPDVTAETST
jgi:uncharacterized protein (DUF736 family)